MGRTPLSDRAGVGRGPWTLKHGRELAGRTRSHQPHLARPMALHVPFYGSAVAPWDTGRPSDPAPRPAPLTLPALGRRCPAPAGRTAGSSGRGPQGAGFHSAFWAESKRLGVGRGSCICPGPQRSAACGESALVSVRRGNQREVRQGHQPLGSRPKAADAWACPACKHTGRPPPPAPMSRLHAEPTAQGRPGPL